MTCVAPAQVLALARQAAAWARRHSWGLLLLAALLVSGGMYAGGVALLRRRAGGEAGRAAHAAIARSSLPAAAPGSVQARRGTAPAKLRACRFAPAGSAVAFCLPTAPPTCRAGACAQGGACTQGAAALQLVTSSLHVIAAHQAYCGRVLGPLTSVRSTGCVCLLLCRVGCRRSLVKHRARCRWRAG